MVPRLGTLHLLLGLVGGVLAVGAAREMTTARALPPPPAPRPARPPAAIAPSPGPVKCTPSARSWATLRCVAGLAHIFQFIAGAARIGLSAARRTEVARSPARPFAIFASRSAVAGAMTIRSASRESRMWPISVSSFRSKRSVNTFSSQSVATDKGVTKCCAPSVSTARTRAPFSRARRIRSSDL